MTDQKRESTSMLAAGASALYGLAARVRGAAYDKGVFRTVRVPGISVVSVGNLRAGGSGKTPLAIWIAKETRDAGLETSLILRGYRGRMERKGGVVSNGSGPLVGPKDAGDEAYMAAVKLDRVEVRVGADRISQALSAAESGAKVAVLDDGFQHRAIHRDLDVVLIAPNDLSPSTRVLPSGPLRELPSAVRRADIVAGLSEEWLDRTITPPVLIDYSPSCLVSMDKESIPLDRLFGAKAYLVAGIARPERFRRTAKAAGFDIAGESFFRDHHRFTAEELSQVRARAVSVGAETIVTTEKDMARLTPTKAEPQILALRIDVQISCGADLLHQRIFKAISSGAHRGHLSEYRPA